MKTLTIACVLAAILVPPSLYAQGESLGDVARRTKAEREALHKAHPNLKARTLEGDGSTPVGGWDEGPDSSGAKEIVDRGLDLDRQGRYDEALQEYGKALKLRPDYARAYYDIGVVKGEQGKTAEAIAAYKQAIALDKTHFESFLNLGKVLSDAGRYAESEEVLRQGLSLFPNNLSLMMNLGNTLAKQSKYEEAIPHFRRILDVAPEWNNARQSLCYSLIRLGRSEEAARVRAEWPAYRPNQN